MSEKQSIREQLHSRPSGSISELEHISERGGFASKKITCESCKKEFNLKANYKTREHEFTNRDGTKYFCKLECKETYILELQKANENEEQETELETIKSNKPNKRINWAEQKQADGSFKCPYCDITAKNPHNASQHVWEVHKQNNKEGELQKASKCLEPTIIPKIKQETNPILILNNNIFEFLKSAPMAYIDAFEPEKLKQLIISARSK